MSRMEIIQRDPDYGRANLIPMPHPSVACLDGDPPEDWYTSAKVCSPFRVGSRHMNAWATLATHAKAENAAMCPVERARGQVSDASAAEIAERNSRRRAAVFAQLSGTPMATRDVCEALGLTMGSTERTLQWLEARGMVTYTEGIRNSRYTRLWVRVDG